MFILHEGGYRQTFSIIAANGKNKFMKNFYKVVNSKLLSKYTTTSLRSKNVNFAIVAIKKKRKIKNTG